MAGFASDSDSDYGYDLTVSDEEQLWAVVDRLSRVSPQSRPAPAIPATPARRTNTSALATNAIACSPFSPDLDPDATLTVEETLAAITDDDLSFDLSELQDDDDDDDAYGDGHGYGHGQAAAQMHDDLPRSRSPERQNSRRLAPEVARGDRSLASFVTKTKPRSMPTLLPGPDISYPDLSRALSDAQEASLVAMAQPKESAEDHRSPLLRFRTFPMKPLSVSDLTAGSWCELQYFYTLTRLPGGRKTRTAAMKRGTKVHEKLERQLFKPVRIEVAKKEDTFGLKMWNMIQGLRVLRDQGFTREYEVWGMVDGNVVCGVIDELTFDNPDQELEEDVLSSRASSQTMTNSQPYEPSTPDDYQIFITDVKTRNSATPPPQAQVRGSIIQLFLYHRFLSDMASGRLDYPRVFERYGLNQDETFSDSFMAQIGAIHDEVFVTDDTESSSTLSDTSTNTDAGSNGDFVSAPSSPSQLSISSSTTEPSLKYRTLRALLTLLKSELHLTFPRGASDLGKIVAVEYRYRGRDSLPPTATTTTTAIDSKPNPFQPTSHHPRSELPTPGSVICTNTFFIEPETLDLFLSETMSWWKGEREPHGVALEEAGFKCRSCEFVNDCEWRRNLDLESLRKARVKREVETEGEEEAEGMKAAEEAETEEREKVKRGRGRPKKVIASAGIRW
ncbi:exonuclease V [Chaetomidium leptoderma]|uniref:Exonuclease V n=1 Tax=Chaetomidium leptoderma TaxID=669021 RepID=A0AAN6ZY03_9PEZI|nr:exonuclease V [Chaetomidium leptoderma]